MNSDCRSEFFRLPPESMSRGARSQDGRERLVRGVDIEGTPLTALSKIVLAANDFETFNGVCGAESGWVGVSATSPSLLISQIEVARREQTVRRPPLLPPPAVPPRPATDSPASQGATQ